MLSHAIWGLLWSVLNTKLIIKSVDQNLEGVRACCAPLWIRQCPLSQTYLFLLLHLSYMHRAFSAVHEHLQRTSVNNSFFSGDTKQYFTKYTTTKKKGTNASWVEMCFYLYFHEIHDFSLPLSFRLGTIQYLLWANVRTSAKDHHSVLTNALHCNATSIIIQQHVHDL